MKGIAIWLLAIVVLGSPFNDKALSQTVVLNGTIVTQQQEPIGYANVLVLDSLRPVQGTLSDSSGRFQLELAPGSYTLEVSILGRKPRYDTLLLARDTDLGYLRLAEDTLTVTGGIISARRPTVIRTVDRLRFLVENTVLSAGNAWQVLQRTPGVYANDGGIQIHGKSGVIVALDGRPLELEGADLRQLLEGMPASQIQAVEVITQPGARWDAQGAAVLNIQRVGAARGGYALDLSGQATQGIYLRSQATAGFRARYRQLGIVAHYSYAPGRRNLKEDATYRYPTDPASTWQEMTDQNTHSVTHNYRLGLDWMVRPRTTLGLEADGQSSQTGGRSLTQTEIFGRRPQADSILLNQTDYFRQHQRQSLNLNLEHQFKSEGRRLNVSTDYLHYRKVGTQLNQTQVLDPGSLRDRWMTFGTDGLQEVGIGSARIDYTQALAGGALALGTRASRSASYNAVDYATDGSSNVLFQDLPENRFRYREDILAAYGSWQRKWSPYWELKMGLRGEFMQRTTTSVGLGEENVFDLWRLFPSLHLQRQGKGDHEWSLGYSRRTRRPGFAFLNPARSFLSPYSYIEGDPFLQPSVSDNADLTYGWKNRLFVTAFGSYQRLPFTQFSLQSTEDRVVRFTTFNYRRSWSAGWVANLQQDLSPRWNLYAEASGYYQREDFTLPEAGGSFTNSGWNLDLVAVNSFTLSEKRGLSAELESVWFSPKVQGGFVIRSISEVSLGLRMRLLQDRASATLYAADLFNGNRTTLVSQYGAQDYLLRENPENQFVRLSFQYRIGNEKWTGRKSQRSNEEEKRRL